MQLSILHIQHSFIWANKKYTAELFFSCQIIVVTFWDINCFCVGVLLCIIIFLSSDNISWCICQLCHSCRLVSPFCWLHPYVSVIVFTVIYLQSNPGGITIFGWTVDRTLLNTIFFLELTLVLFVLSKTIVLPSMWPSIDGIPKFCPNLCTHIAHVR